MASVVMNGLGLPPETLCGYIEDMLMELGDMAERTGEPTLRAAIAAAALLAGEINARRQAHGPALKHDAA